jgi:hypothetical protein
VGVAWVAGVDERRQLLARFDERLGGSADSGGTTAKAAGGDQGAGQEELAGSTRVRAPAEEWFGMACSQGRGPDPP